jgi:hypothetical protein
VQKLIAAGAIETCSFLIYLQQPAFVRSKPENTASRLCTNTRGPDILTELSRGFSRTFWRHHLKIGHDQFCLHPSLFIICTHPSTRRYAICVVEKASVNSLIISTQRYHMDKKNWPYVWLINWLTGHYWYQLNVFNGMDCRLTILGLFFFSRGSTLLEGPWPPHIGGFLSYLDIL